VCVCVLMCACIDCLIFCRILLKALHVYVCMSEREIVRVYVCICVHMCACVYARMYVCVCECAYACVCVRA